MQSSLTRTRTIGPERASVILSKDTDMVHLFKNEKIEPVKMVSHDGKFNLSRVKEKG